jgi:hypothetical protein
MISESDRLHIEIARWTVISDLGLTGIATGLVFSGFAYQLMLPSLATVGLVSVFVGICIFAISFYNLSKLKY